MATRSGQRRRGGAANRNREGRQAGQAQPQARQAQPGTAKAAPQARQAPAPATQQSAQQPSPAPAQARPAPAQARPSRQASARPRPARRPPRRRQAPSALPAWLPDGLQRLADGSGIPGWALVAGALTWLLALLLLATGATKWSFAIWLGALLSAVIGGACLSARIASGKQPLRALRGAGLVFVAAGVPVVFDPHSGDVFNLPKYAVVVVTALALAGLWVIAAVYERRVPAWRNGLQWILAATVVWGLISALAGVDPHVGLLGNYGSYDGWYVAAAFAVVTMTLAESLDAGDVRRAMGTVAFCGGTVVVLYGLIQLHDTELAGAKWDFIKWNHGSFLDEIFSTFGNPNHLGGYTAILLPVALIIGLTAKRWQWKALSGLFDIALLAELVRTSARGAWVAAIAAVVVLAIYLAPEIKRRPIPFLGGTGVVVVVAAAGMAVKGRHFLGHSLSTLFQSGGASSVEQRFEIWKAAWQIALHHPLTGIGPDAFALIYPQYQSAKWVAAFTPNYLVNGAHDIFMNYLADQGFIGLAIFLAVLVFAGLRSVGAWRRFRVLERAESVGDAVQRDARDKRLLLAAATASITAYVVQAVFNVQQVGLSMMFWTMLGLLLVLATSAGVPDTLKPATLLSMATASTDGAAERKPAGTGALAPARTRIPPRRGRGRRQEVPWPTLATGAVVVAAVAFLSVGAEAPYRADHAYWAAANSLGETSGSNASSKAPKQVTAAYFNDMKSAIALNPWEPTYPYAEAGIYENISQHSPSASSRLTYMTDAHNLYARAEADEPLWAPYPAALAQADVQMANLVPAQAVSYLANARSMAEKAVKDNPRDTTYHQLLTSIVADQHKAAAAAAKPKAPAKAKAPAKPKTPVKPKTPAKVH